LKQGYCQDISANEANPARLLSHLDKQLALDMCSYEQLARATPMILWQSQQVLAAVTQSLRN
jgi:hypothetical protein